MASLPLIWVRGRDVSAAASRGNRGEPLASLMPCRLRQGKGTSARSQPCDRRDHENQGQLMLTVDRACCQERAIQSSVLPSMGQGIAQRWPQPPNRRWLRPFNEELRLSESYWIICAWA